MVDLIGLITLWAGIIFAVIGVIGVLRFSDVYSRLHAAGVLTNFGLGFILLGVVIMQPEHMLKLAVLFIFLFITSPVSSYAIATAERAYERAAEDDSIETPTMSDQPNTSNAV